MSQNAKVALAAIWALWSLGWGLLWALTGIGLLITIPCVVVAIVPFFLIRERRAPSGPPADWGPEIPPRDHR